MTALFITIFIGIQIVSLLIMGANIFEFHHIHQKRIDLMRSLGCPRIRIEILQRRLLIALYSVLTLTLLVFTSMLFLQFFP